MRKVLLLIFLSISSVAVRAQAVPDGYQFVGQFESDPTDLLDDILLSADGKYLVTDFGTKPTTIKIFNTHSWQIIQTLELKGWVALAISFFDDENSDHCYLVGRGRKYHKLNLADGSHEKLKSRHISSELLAQTGWLWKTRQASSTEQNGVIMRMLPEKYVLKIYKDVTEVYIWQDLLD